MRTHIGMVAFYKLLLPGLKIKHRDLDGKEAFTMTIDRVAGNGDLFATTEEGVKRFIYVENIEEATLPDGEVIVMDRSL